MDCAVYQMYTTGTIIEISLKKRDIMKSPFLETEYNEESLKSVKQLPEISV